MKLNWIKCVLQSRCRLNIVNLENEHFDNLLGVYIIWQGIDKLNVIDIGQGFIRERLEVLRKDKNLQGFAPDLYATWASVPDVNLDGVEAFLYNQLHPKIHHAIICNEPIHVNLP